MPRILSSSIGLIVTIVALSFGSDSAQAQGYFYAPGYGNPAIGQYWGSSYYDPRFSYTLPGYTVYSPGFYGYGPAFGYGYGGFYGPRYGYGHYGYGYGPHHYGYGPRYGYRHHY